MRVLLDTCAFLRRIENEKRLNVNATPAISNPETDTWLSIGGIWEIAIEQNPGNLDTAATLRIHECLRQATMQLELYR